MASRQGSLDQRHFDAEDSEVQLGAAYSQTPGEHRG